MCLALGRRGKIPRERRSRVNPPALFTIARIAQELGRTRQSVYLSFAGINPDGEAIVRGQRASGWMVASFPKTIFEELETIRVRKQLRSIADLLSAPPSRYVSPVPFAEVTPTEREKALKLRHALRPFLIQRSGAEISREEFARRGVDEYRRVLGYFIGTKHWRALLGRTIARDSDREEWDFPDLYLPDKPARLAVALPIAAAREAALEVLEDALLAVTPKGPLNIERKDYLWTKACDQLQLAIVAGANAKKTKRAIIKSLLVSGLLGANKETIRRNLDQHWREYCANGGKPLKDRRTLRKKEVLSDEDRNKIAGIGLAHVALAPAWREAQEKGLLSDAEQERYSPRVLSVPHRIRRECGPMIASLMSVATDKRSEREDGPSHHGDYSRLFAGEIFSMDDWTPEHVSYVYGPSGLPRFIQGQIIPVLDFASRRILHWSFTEGAYTAAMIRVTLNRACEEYCLPETLVIENGLWKRSKLIVGKKNVIGDDEWELGLREFMKVNHARRPQGKANIEKWFDQLGKLMRTSPGWCGPDMRTTMPRDLQRKVALAKSGNLDPSSFCFSEDEMIQAISEAIARYNATPQPHSKILKGASPNDAWNAKQSPEGRPSLGREAAYLQAYHREELTVKNCQIKKTHGGSDHYFHGPELARFDRRKVLVWWNPMDLGQIGVSPDRKSGIVVVPRQSETPVLGKPDYAAVGRVQRAIDETLEARRVIFRSCQPWMVKTRLRPTLTDRTTAAFGAKLEEETTRTKEAQSVQKRQVQGAQRLARASGLTVNVDHSNATRVAAAAELLREAYEESGEESEP